MKENSARSNDTGTKVIYQRHNRFTLYESTLFNSIYRFWWMCHYESGIRIMNAIYSIVITELEY